VNINTLCSYLELDVEKKSGIETLEERFAPWKIEKIEKLVVKVNRSKWFLKADPLQDSEFMLY
jgi:hypothetical protein